jgi:type I restriction enzyme S subunit
MTLPSGWVVKPLEELCEPGKGSIVDGPFGSNLKRSDYKDSGMPVLKIQNIKENQIILKKMDYVTKSKYQELERHSFTNGDIVMTKLGDPLGVSAIVSNLPDGLIVADLVRIRPSKVSTKFLCYQLNSPGIQKFINNQQKGTTRPRVNLSMIRNLPIVVPELSEQERIVEILEDHLSRLDAALADVKQAKLKAAQFRVSFMRDVFRGTQDWEHLKLRELGKWQGGGTPSKSNPAYWTNGTIPWISPKDMGLDEISSTQDLISEDAVSNSSVNKIDANSVVVVVRSGILERVLPISIINMTATLNQDMKALTLNDRVLPKFAFYLLQAFQQDILQKCRKTGTTVASINTEALMNYGVKVPTIREQESLLAYLESQISRIQGSTKLIDVAEKTGSSLRRSLLQAAFTGQLTKEEVNV